VKTTICFNIFFILSSDKTKDMSFNRCHALYPVTIIIFQNRTLLKCEKSKTKTYVYYCRRPTYHLLHPVYESIYYNTSPEPTWNCVGVSNAIKQDLLLLSSSRQPYNILYYYYTFHLRCPSLRIYRLSIGITIGVAVIRLL